MNEQVWVIRSRETADGRIGRTRVYLRKRDAMSRGRKWRDAGYNIELLCADIDLQHADIED